MENKVRVIVPDDEIDRVVIDLDTRDCSVFWKKSKKVQQGIAVEFIYGQQGTWARIALNDEPDKTLCISQSGQMQPVCFYYDEPPVIPEAPPIVVSEEDLSGFVSIPLEQVT